MQVPSTQLQGLTEPNDFGGFIDGSRAISYQALIVGIRIELDRENHFGKFLLQNRSTDAWQPHNSRADFFPLLQKLQVVNSAR